MEAVTALVATIGAVLVVCALVFAVTLGILALADGVVKRLLRADMRRLDRKETTAGIRWAAQRRCRRWEREGRQPFMSDRLIVRAIRLRQED